ncbi:serine/threonine-protein kinase [Micromonospora sp. NPDC049559]|uniref:serine/threonine-protein kinase n=1 Tax=Micromonospora sp. NPDC049559 TaxID=3155923 RepID=UPI003426B3D1
MGGAGGAVEIGPRLLGGRYRLVERLGAGGMSVVWRGYDEVLGRQVAVKVLADSLASDRSFRHRIRLEAQAAARLCHPNITNVYDYGEAVEAGATIPYVVMELVGGESLASRLGRRNRLPWREAVTACAEVAAALATAHARGVVHRDVTPGNVMLTRTGAKVVDFGISAVVGEREAGPDGHLLGTPAYLAPERLEDGQVSPATDVYALGLLLYRMLSGRLPWDASTGTELLRAHLYQDPAPLPPVDGLPEEVARLCERCLAKAPEQRPASVALARTLAEAAGILVALPVAGDATTAAGAPEAGTTLLPWSAETDTLPPSLSRREATARREAVARRRRRAEAMVVGAGLLAITGLVWAGTSRTPSSGGAEPAAADAVPASCRVEYALREDSGNAFDAELKVTNTGRTPLRDWELTFAFPGDQTVHGGRSAYWSQRGRDVTAEPASEQSELLPGASAALGLTGSYAGANPLPVRFRLAGSVCDVQVSAMAGRPAQTPGTRAVAAVTSPAAPARGGTGAGERAGSPGGGGPSRPKIGEKKPGPPPHDGPKEKAKGKGRADD